MHRCIGNDDLENKRIYEESLHPERMLETVKVKREFSHLNDPIVKTIRKMPKMKISQNRVTQNSLNEVKKTIVYAIGLTIFVLLLMIFMS